MKNKTLKEKIIESMFAVSKKPVLFKDLLEANASFNEGMLVDPGKLNFKFRYGKSYMIFSVICFLVFIPFTILTHDFFQKIDFHISIIATILATSGVFVTFDIFKAWARKSLTKQLIKKAWENHLPFFPYEKYSTKVEEVYEEALKKELPKRDLEKYILDSLVQND
ncbi:putative membrane protein [Campylobacter blaseri]|uniref:Uncharacterized protein n=1 Tax=Campylobacter blaseri TaxID=2042961 RepID=A0A2P8QZN2_9BACT|nr:hypothetical protein [Campylobacter blaseri]PSM51701.1 hypothetical protein CQ405_06090 [Campylobacter blaseri]PSM53491.1 hypothetical protein CRN67_06090 [Campylobacter blaseri]QKF86296.1 putative membrane protein [Campylobacter blaseri]